MALKYQAAVGSVNLAATGGHFILEDGDTAFEIYEFSGEFDIDTGILPIFVFGQYAINASADNGEDTACLAGFATKYGPFKLSYNYRDSQKFAVADTYND